MASVSVVTDLNVPKMRRYVVAPLTELERNDFSHHRFTITGSRVEADRVSELTRSSKAGILSG